jgi:hypothetical protein
MGKTIRNRSNRETSGTTKNVQSKKKEFIDDNTKIYKKNIELVADTFELRSPKVQENYNQPWEHSEIEYEMGGEN